MNIQKYRPDLFFFWPSFLLLIASCAPNPAAPEVERLALDLGKLTCQQAVLEQQTTALWDSVAAYLDRSLPPEMPSAERRNLLAVRNAGLIRMFEVYPALSDSIRQLVDAAELEDRRIVEEVRQLMVRRDELEGRRRVLFERIDQKRPAEVPALRQLFTMIAERPCTNNY